MTLENGITIGPYEILAPLGAGGMGEVYQARDTRLDRSVAVKALPEAFASEPERLARFEREAKLLAALNHPNVAAIYGLEEREGRQFLVLEFVDGETLAQRIARGPLPVREALEIGAQIASAIAAAHERGIVHRDLKPGNVMLTKSRTVKVLDFGLAKGAAAEGESSPALSVTPTRVHSATGEGIILGTAPYMSPEQARGKPVDGRTDVWAFGCILFECLTGRQAFGGETASDVIARILEREPEWETLPGSVPSRFKEIISSCLSKEIGRRPGKMDALRKELSAIAVDLTTAAASPAKARLPSLAVLYFENQASDSESEYFCSGITEDILTDLSKIKGLRVASRNAVARYRGEAADIEEVAGNLGVDAVLEGSVRRAGDRVRITAQLINGADGFQIWAERYDRTLQDVFAVQEEIASAITEALRVALTPSESENLVKDRPRDVRAYDLYLQGREQYSKYNAEGFQKAIELFERAIEIDPEYALAYAGLADVYGQMCQWGVAGDPAEAIRKGLDAARLAISLNPKLAEGYKAEGLVLRFTGDLEGSRISLTKALEANPRFTPALINLAVDRFSQADLAATERLIRRCIEIDPQESFAITWLAFLMNFTARFDEAISVAKHLRETSSDNFYVTAAYGLQTMSHLGRGDLSATEQSMREALADGADENNVRCFEALLAARRGESEQAKSILREYENQRGLGSGTLIVLGSAACRVGEPDLALPFVTRSILVDPAPVIIRLTHDLHPLAEHERFAPRRLDATLVWPLEAPMVDPACFALFREVHIQSGSPKGSTMQVG